MEEIASSSQSEQVRPSLDTIPPEIILLIADFLFGDPSRSAYDLEDMTCSLVSLQYRCPQKIRTGAKTEGGFSGFDPERDVIHLAATCRKLHTVLTPAIYKHDVRQNYSSALFIATKKGITNAVFLSLQAGADINAQDRTIFDYDTDRRQEQTDRYPVQSSLTALHWAAFFGNEELTKLLIARGASINARADMGYRYYRWYGTDEWAEDGLEFDNPQRTMFYPSETEYQYDQLHGSRRKYDGMHLGAKPLFFALKADTDSSNYSRWLLLVDDPDGPHPHVVQGYESDKRYSMARLLIKHGSSLITREYGAIHALHQATAYVNEEMIKLLVDEMGVCPNIRDADGNTPLHYLGIESSPFFMNHRILQLLLARGADPTLQNSKGQTPRYQFKWRLDG